MRERELELKLVKAVNTAGGLCIKLSCPSYGGMPDRICLLPGGVAFFVEVKRRGEKPCPLQLVRHGMLRDFGFKVYVLDSVEQIPAILNDCM